MKPFRDDNTAGYTEIELDEFNAAFEALEPDAYHNEEWAEQGRKDLVKKILDAYDDGELAELVAKAKR